MAQKTQKKGKKKKRSKKKNEKSNVILIVVLLIILTVLLLSIRTAFKLGEARRPQNEEPTPSPTEYLPPSTLVAEGFGWENGFKTYSANGVTASIGIDVSSHQEWIDWTQVAESGIDFAIIQAGFRGYEDGEIHPDAYFTYNIENAIANGLDVGVYFFSQALNEEEARAEAKAVLEQVSGYDIQYPIYYDWETISGDEARTDTITTSELTACAQAFCQTIVEAGYETGIYFNLTQAMRYFRLNELSDYDFWLAEYQEVPTYPFAIDMWQYSSGGSVPGIDTRVDMDLSFR